MNLSKFFTVVSDKGFDVLVNRDMVNAVFDLGDKRKIDMGSSYVYTEETLEDLHGEMITD